mmetsp:Transcript_31672/g.71206  ORF Transcript_31672/g.71206 Transcript_31672/m.71206 type:complete len:290 (+) Transcript_31672:89-958(+)
MTVAAFAILVATALSGSLGSADAQKTGFSICHENMINTYSTHSNQECYKDYASFRANMETEGLSYGDWNDFCSPKISAATCAAFDQRLQRSREIESCKIPAATASQAEVRCAEALSACYYCNGLAYQGKGGSSPERDKRKCDCAGSETVSASGPLPPCIAQALGGGLDYFISADGEQSTSTQEAGVNWCRESAGGRMSPLILGLAIGLPVALLFGIGLCVVYQDRMGLLETVDDDGDNDSHGDDYEGDIDRDEGRRAAEALENQRSSRIGTSTEDEQIAKAISNSMKEK